MMQDPVDKLGRTQLAHRNQSFLTTRCRGGALLTMDPDGSRSLKLGAGPPGGETLPHTRYRPPARRVAAGGALPAMKRACPRR